MPSPESLEPWTVGQLRAELVGLDDSMPVAVYVEDRADPAVLVRQSLVGAGYGPGLDPSDVPADEFPLVARQSRSAD
ncbi:hypothetical protein [Pengzhenrongella sp.]|uniref:hypothetical protein n=1 Tax=Pengzhenrongella sp. TaxID=2888820 RepID=UPI002F9589BA